MLYQLKAACPQTAKAIAKSYAKIVAGIGQGLSKPAGRFLAWSSTLVGAGGTGPDRSPVRTETPPTRGRPTVMPIIRAELERCAREGNLETEQAQQMRVLRSWFVAQYPGDRRTPKFKTLTRKLGGVYNALKDELK